MSVEDRNGRDGLPSADRGNLLWVDPDELMLDNPAALIVNRDTYEGMEAYFSEERFRKYPPEVARVTVCTSTGVTQKIFVVDGLTRTKFASDHKGRVLKDAPDVKFDTMQVFDITSELLHDPRIVLMQEYQPDQQALTILQYLRAVIKPTIVHKEIASDRIAGHLINAWQGTVGPDLAGRFPALAALSFLANPKIPIAPDRELQKALARQELLVAKESRDERERLEKALRDQATIIMMSGLQRGEVARQAYFLVGSGSAVIGGTQETRNQIFALLRSNAFEGKLTKEYRGHGGEAEVTRSGFARALEEAFVRLSKGSGESEGALTDIKGALDDASLSISQTLKVITSASPTREYAEVRKDINRQALTEQYQKAVKRKTLTDTEQILITNLGEQTHPNIPSMISEIQSCAIILRQSQDWQEKLKIELANFVRRGVSEATINQAIEQMSQKQASIMTASSSRTLADRTRDLQKSFDLSRRKIADEIMFHDVKGTVSQVFGDELVVDPQFVDKVAWAMIHDKELDKSVPADLQAWARRFKKLEPDIQKDMMTGHITTMTVAMKMQNQRRVVDVVLGDKRASTPVAAPTPQSAKPAELTLAQPGISQEEIRRRRIEMNIKRLTEEIIEPHLVPIIRLFATIDLQPSEIPDDLKKILGEAEIAIEGKRGGHPNVVRVMDEDYGKSQKEITRLREILLGQQREQADRDTRTNQ